MNTGQIMIKALLAPLPLAGLALGPLASSSIAQPLPQTDAADDAAATREIYIAPLQPINDDLTEQIPLGLVSIIILDDEMRMYVMAEGLPAGIPHLQHYHGFIDGAEATCPTAEADINNDGVVDLIETQPAAGQTLVPIHDAPASLEGLLAIERFPTASEPDGVIDYRGTVSLQALESALQSQHGIGELDLQNRVVFIHGVGEGANIPDSAESIADVPASVTLPIACGEFTRVD